jgi:hypothetical protein
MDRLRRVVGAASMLAVVVALISAVGLSSASYGATSFRHRGRIIRVRPPVVVIAGKPAIVHGTVDRRLEVRRVTLERQRPPDDEWKVIAHSGVRHRRFTFTVTAPQMTGALKLRVVAGPVHHPTAKSRPFALPVTQTQVLSPANIVSAPAPGTSGELVYDGEAKPNSDGFIALGIGPQTPDGLLVHVTGVSGASGHWVLTVKPASLFDAIPTGHLQLPVASAGATTASGHAATTLRPQFDLTCSSGASAQASGSASLSLHPTLDLNWGWNFFPPHPVVNSARFTMTASGSVKASASLQGSGSCKFKQQLLDHDFSPIDFQVGPIPVVIVPELLVTLKADANASASISTDVTASVSATGGLADDQGRISPIASFNKSFSFQPPTPQGKGSIGARLVPAGRLLLYGIAGPEVDLSAGPQFDIDTRSDSTWRFYVPVDLSAKLVVPGTPFSQGPLDVYRHEFTLAHGTIPPPPSQHQLTVTVNGPGTVSGNGISCPGTCTASYPTGTTVMLQASPDAGANFSGWSGDCSGTSGCTLDMNADHSVNADFTTPSGSGLIVGNNAANGGGPIQTYDFTTGTLVNSFVPDGATSGPGNNGRALAVAGDEVFYSELFNGGPTDAIHVAPFNDGAGGSDIRTIPNPAPSTGIQDLDYANGALYALTGYANGPLQAWKLDPRTGAVLAGPIAINSNPSADGFVVLPDGNFLINSGDESCTYTEYDSPTGTPTGSSFTVPGANQCTGVALNGQSLYFETDFDSFTQTDLTGNLITRTTVAPNLVEDIAVTS